MKRITLTVCVILLTMAGINAQSLYDFKITTIKNETIPLSNFRGKKVLMVNTASECGYTPQYKDLQALSVKYKQSLVVIGFPSNDFGEQEPGSNNDIAAFCSKNYGVTFIMSQKVTVVGDQIAPLFKWMTHLDNPDFTGDIKWNFEKFLFSETGELLHRYRSKISPAEIEKDL